VRHGLRLHDVPVPDVAAGGVVNLAVDMGGITRDEWGALRFAEDEGRRIIRRSQ
jgi:hypothetical protein